MEKKLRICINIYDNGSSYFQVGNDDKYGVIDVNGNEVVPIQYQDITITTTDLFNGEITVIAQLNDTEYVIYNLDRGTISSSIQTTEGQFEIRGVHVFTEKHYIYVSELTDYNQNNYTYKYYTYDGKMFYTKSNMGLFYE